MNQSIGIFVFFWSFIGFLLTFCSNEIFDDFIGPLSDKFKSNTLSTTVTFILTLICFGPVCLIVGSIVLSIMKICEMKMFIKFQKFLLGIVGRMTRFVSRIVTSVDNFFVSIESKFNNNKTK